MHHQRRIDAVERAGARHQLLAAAVLLRRRAEQPDARRKRGTELGQGERGAERGGRDQVVAAGVADAGQRIVLGEQRDERTVARAEIDGERGRQAVGAW
jgi:hypothetical protein